MDKTEGISKTYFVLYNEEVNRFIFDPEYTTLDFTLAYKFNDILEAEIYRDNNHINSRYKITKATEKTVVEYTILER